MTQQTQHRYYRCEANLSAYHVRPDGTMADYTIYPNNETAHIELHQTSGLIDAKEYNLPAIEITQEEFTAHKWRVIDFLKAKEVMP